MKLSYLILGRNYDYLQGREAMATPVETEKEIAQIIPVNFKDDVTALTNYIGKARFKSGLNIEISLSELLTIVPRSRQRSNAYNSLIKYLQDEQKITLTITNYKR